MTPLDLLKYPIGKYIKPTEITENQIQNWIGTIENFPKKLQLISHNLTDEDLNKTYRPAGWTIKQVVHHCADSHINAYIRMKLALTELLPVINPYNEAIWANLPDGNQDAISASLLLIEGLHQRWVVFLKNLTIYELRRAYYHPGNNENVAIETAIGLYAWHCNHHLAYIEMAIANKN